MKQGNLKYVHVYANSA